MTSDDLKDEAEKVLRGQGNMKGDRFVSWALLMGAAGVVAAIDRLALVIEHKDPG